MPSDRPTGHARESPRGRGGNRLVAAHHADAGDSGIADGKDAQAAAGKYGIRRRVTMPCTSTNGNSASDPRRPAASFARDLRLLELESA
jgi:hypothetical protein